MKARILRLESIFGSFFIWPSSIKSFFYLASDFFKFDAEEVFDPDDFVLEVFRDVSRHQVVFR